MNFHSAIVNQGLDFVFRIDRNEFRTKKWYNEQNTIYFKVLCLKVPY